MSIQTISDVINNAQSIKRYPNEYHVYSTGATTIFYCDDSGEPTSFSTGINGTRFPLDVTVRPRIASLLMYCYVMKCHQLVQTNPYFNKK